MWCIKDERKINTMSDVRSMITSIIFRQKDPFEKTMIMTIIAQYLQGANYHIEESELEKMIDEQLDLYCRNSELNCTNGIYKGMVLR